MKFLTSAVNNPDFIEMQAAQFKKHLKFPYEFIVFNDAKSFPDYTNFYDTTLRLQITRCCERLGIQCIECDNDHHKEPQMFNVSDRAADIMNLMTEYMIKNPDAYVIIDSDMFLIDDLKGNPYIRFDSAIVPQYKSGSIPYGPVIKYPWNGLVYFNTINPTTMKYMKLVKWNTCKGCDTGGMMQEWMKKPISIKKIEYLASGEWGPDTGINMTLSQPFYEFIKTDPRNENGSFFSEIYDYLWFHFRSGSNWRGGSRDQYMALTKALKGVLLSTVSD